MDRSVSERRYGRRHEENRSNRRRNTNTWKKNNKTSSHYRHGNKRAASDSSTRDEIEEQLRQQRSRKAAEASSSVSAATSSASNAQHAQDITLGSYVYDPVRKAYFPRSYAATQSNSSEMDNNDTIFSKKKAKRSSNYPLDHRIGFLTDFSSFSHVLLHCDAPLCSSTRKKRVMYDVARGLAVTDGAHVVPSSVYVGEDESYLSTHIHGDIANRKERTKWQTILAPYRAGTR